MPQWDDRTADARRALQNVFAVLRSLPVGRIICGSCRTLRCQVQSRWQESHPLQCRWGGLQHVDQFHHGLVGFGSGGFESLLEGMQKRQSPSDNRPDMEPFRDMLLEPFRYGIDGDICGDCGSPISTPLSACEPRYRKGAEGVPKGYRRGTEPLLWNPS